MGYGCSVGVGDGALDDGAEPGADVFGYRREGLKLRGFALPMPSDRGWLKLYLLQMCASCSRA